MLTPSLRKPSRNFGPIVPEATSKHGTAELSRLSTGANDGPNDGFAVSARFHPRLGSAVRPSAQLIGQLAAEQIVVALAQVEPELRQYEPRCESHSRRFRQRGWLSAAEQHQARTPPLATRSRGGGFARAAAAWSGSCSPVTQSEPSGNSVARGADPVEYRRGGGSSQAPRRLRLSLVALRRSQRDRARRRSTPARPSAGRISLPGWASCPSGDLGRGGRAHPYRLGPGLRAFEADVGTRVGHVLDLACAPAHIKLFTSSAVSICRRGR